MPSRRSLCYLHCTPNVSLILPCHSVTYSICLSATCVPAICSLSVTQSMGLWRFQCLSVTYSLYILLLAPCLPVTYYLCLTDSPVSRFMLSFHLSLVYLYWSSIVFLCCLLPVSLCLRILLYVSLGHLCPVSFYYLLPVRAVCCCDYPLLVPDNPATIVLVAVPGT